MQHSPIDFCRETVRQWDYPRYVCALFAPASLRDGVFALLAFYCEIRRTRQVVSEPMMGMIRLQWWRDSLDALYAGLMPEHDIFRILAPIRDKLAQADFHELLDAIERDLTTQQPETLAEMVESIRSETLPLTRLHLGLYGMEITDTMAQAALAYGFVRHYNATAALARQGRVMLPEAVATRHGVDLVAWLRGNEQAGLSGFFAEMMQTGRGLVPKISRQHIRLAPSVGLEAAVARVMLASLQRVGGNPLALKPDGLLPLRLCFANFFGSK